jgi:6-phosphogluconolactonase (cycloisomerase 2 family)
MAFRRASRRQFLSLAAFAGAAAFASRASVSALARQPPGVAQGSPPVRARIACVGAFTSKARNARGEGLSVFRIDPITGAWTRIQLLGDELNPSFLALDARRRFLYAVHADSDQVSAFAIDPESGTLTLVNRQSTGGANPAHLSLDPSGRFLVVANYGAGSVAAVPVRADGSLGARTDLVTLTGEPGPHRTEQASSHPHQCPFDPSGRFVVVPDKGLDRVFVFRLDTAIGKLVPADQPFVKTRTGAGPRHVGFHPRLPFAWVINELDSTIAAYRLESSGVLEPVQIVPSIPATFTGNNTGSGIVVSASGRFVFVSNRGHDSIGAFRVDEQSGMLVPVAWEPTGGATPRFIGAGPVDNLLYAANQNGDTIVEFDIDAATGRLRRTGRSVSTGTPVCVVWQ